MADETSRAAETTSAARPTREYANVEFLDTARSNPLNVLRQKVKELDELEDSVVVGRVLIITELFVDGERGFDVVWSENPQENECSVQDSVISTLTRVKNALSGGE